MSVRAAIVVTGTEVLTGRVTDRNGPWLSDRLRELGVDLAHISVVGDRPGDMLAALRFHASEGVAVICTSGGLGPTEDDRTATVVGEFCGREMVLDELLEERIAEILRPLAKRFPSLDLEAVRAANRKQAVIPSGAAILAPVGTAPGLVVGPREGARGPVVVVLPGPPRELQPMWAKAVETDLFRAAIAGAGVYRQRMLRLFGIPESEIAETMRRARDGGIDLDSLEITTCLRRGEVEIVTRWEPPCDDVYERFEALVRERHADTLFSDDGTTVDEQVAALLRAQGQTLAVAESCTGGLVSGRLTTPPGASDYFRGAITVYSDAAKVELACVAPETLERHGAVSEQVAQALALGARARFAAGVGLGVTGIAGPSGATTEKPVGLVWLSVAGPDGEFLTRSVQLPGGRDDIRDRTTTVALHMLLRVLHDRRDGVGVSPGQ